MGERIVLDGSYGEGGGQILRTALSLSAVTGRAIRVERIRAARPRPGLAAQHLTAARAVASLCAGQLRGDEVGSLVLEFDPGGPPAPGHYAVDVGAVRAGGSAGAVTLVLQAVCLPLAFARGPSTVILRGGTHTEWSPPFDFIAEVYLPTLRRMGVEARAELVRFGWYPAGAGEARVEIAGGAERLEPLACVERGALRAIRGRAVASRLPAHVPERMAACARRLLAETGLRAEIAAEIAEAACPGTGIFLVAEYEEIRCGFGALGRRGRPAEAVGEAAASALLRHHRSSGALDPFLADQVLLPSALASGPSRFTTSRLTDHLATNAWAIERFEVAAVKIREEGPQRVAVEVEPRR